jgi:signal transduction histidine kinase
MRAIVLNPLRWTLAVRAPLLFAAFMIVVSIAMTNAVLTRLAETQERQLAQLSRVHLDGLASSIMPYVLRDDVWEVFDAVERNASVGSGFGLTRVVVTDAAGRTIASNVPSTFPVGSDPSAFVAGFKTDDRLSLNASTATASAHRSLVHQDRRIGDIYASFDVSALLDERAAVLRTLVMTNTVVALAFAGLGYWLMRRMLTPLRHLSAHLDRSARGPVAPIPLALGGTEGSEFRRLFVRFNGLAEAVNEREALAKQLAQEERLASLGRLASGMAHEINNPLGGLFNAIDTLKAHGDKATVRASSLSLIDRGLRGIRDVVRSALATYRADRDQRPLVMADLNDIRFLIAPEANRRDVVLEWVCGGLETASLPASAVRQILLNLVLNAVQATPPGQTVSVGVHLDEFALAMTVEDKGPGLSVDARETLMGSVTRPVAFGEGTGLGLWMTRRLVVELFGAITTETSAAGGAIIRVRLPVPHAEELRHVA